MKAILIVFNLLSLLLFIAVGDIDASRNRLVSKMTQNTSSQKKGPQWYQYEPAIVSLKGVLLIKSAYGPPGYGENPLTDEKVKYLVLKLDTPINVNGDSDPNSVNLNTFTNISEIQLVLFGDQMKKNASDKVNKKVVLTGKLFEAHTGHHYTDVLMEVQQIELVE